MRVRMIKERRVRISPLSTRVYHAGWEGHVDDALAQSWMVDGAATPLDAAAEAVIASPPQTSAAAFDGEVRGEIRGAEIVEPTKKPRAKASKR